MKPQLSICLVPDRRLPHFAAVEVQLFEGYEPKVGDKLCLVSEVEKRDRFVDAAMSKVCDACAQHYCDADCPAFLGNHLVRMSIADRLRPGKDAEPWVIEQIRELEQSWNRINAALTRARQQPAEKIELVQDGGGA
jgi:hypothetical protein